MGQEMSVGMTRWARSQEWYLLAETTCGSTPCGFEFLDIGCAWYVLGHSVTQADQERGLKEETKKGG